jgi:hypothetical protein
MATAVLPLTKAIYLCEDVIEDRSNHNIHLIGTFNAIRPADSVYPYRPAQLCVFAQMVGGVEEASIHVEIADTRSGALVYAWPEQRIRFPGRRTTVFACFRILNCVFPEPGVYVVELYANRVFLDDRILHLIAPEEMES